jgi:beta-lactamase regulating signal transducer with metallopeptidase domain
MPAFWNDEWTARLATTLLHFCWQGVVIALGTWAMMALASRATTRYAIGCAAMLLMLAAPVATLLWPDVTHAPLASRSANVAGVSVDSSPALPPRATAAVEDARPPFELASWVVWTWAGGVTLLAVHHLLGLASLGRLRRHCTPIKDELLIERCRAMCARLAVRPSVRLLRCDRLDSPAVVGLFRPVILWPGALLSGLTPAQLDALLAHELAHITRNDYLVNLMQTLIESLLFYHPCVWWLSRRVRQEREHCCDDRAAQAVGDRLTIAQALAALESKRHGLPLAPSARGGSLMKRIQRLLRPLPTHSIGGRAAAIVLALMALTFATAWTTHAQEGASAQTTADKDFRSRIGELSFKSRDVHQQIVNLERDHSLWSPEVTAARDAERDATRQLVDALFERFNAAEEPPAIAEQPPGKEGEYDRLMRDEDFVALLLRESRIRFGPTALATTRLGELVEAKKLSADARSQEAPMLAEDGLVAEERLEHAAAQATGPSTRLVENVETRQVEVDVARQAASEADSALAQLRKLERDLREVNTEIAHVESTAGKDAPQLKDMRGLAQNLSSRILALTSPVGEYYVAPPANRPGVYSLSGRQISLQQAIIAAGGFDDSILADQEDGVVVELVRRVQGADGAEIEVKRFRWPDIRDNKVGIFFLVPDDQLRFRLAELGAQSPHLKVIQAEVENLESELAKLRTAFGPNSPQVKRIETQIQTLRESITPAATTKPAPSMK